MVVFAAIQIGLNVTEYSVAEGESFTVTVAVVGSPDISGDITVNLSTSCELQSSGELQVYQ